MRRGQRHGREQAGDEEKGQQSISHSGNIDQPW
jgi:hypothetical protein